MSILEEIFAHKRTEVARQRASRALAAVRQAARQVQPPLDFAAALRNSARRPALIAEVKCASPSRGLLAHAFDPLGLAATYSQNGAAAISVLTDEHYFMGHLDHLRSLARQTRRVPLLRKDFLYDPYQVYEARAAGADAILLIVAALDLPALRDLQALALSLGMAALVEVHDGHELETALASGTTMVGINNRDLHSFTVDLATTDELCRLVPKTVAVVAESGIHTAEDVARLADLVRDDGSPGVDAMLVGEGLVTAADTAAKVRSLADAGHLRTDRPTSISGMETAR